MKNNIFLIICIISWGLGTFLNRLSVEKMSPILMQAVVGLVYLFYIPFALYISGFDNIKFAWSSVWLTVGATICSIIANVLLFYTLKGSKTTGASTMLISLYPVATLILSWVFLHEVFTIKKIIGIIAMICGAILLL